MKSRLGQRLSSEGRWILSELVREDAPQLTRHQVVRKEETVLVRKGDEVAIEEPMAGREEGESILNNVRTAVGNRPDMCSLDLDPATAVHDAKSGDRTRSPIRAHHGRTERCVSERTVHEHLDHATVLLLRRCIDEDPNAWLRMCLA